MISMTKRLIVKKEDMLLNESNELKTLASERKKFESLRVKSQKFCVIRKEEERNTL